MQNVIELKRSPNKVTSYEVDEAVMRDLRLRMYEWAPKELAEEMDVSVNCIYAIRAGRTKWPRGTTLFALLRALDIQFRLYDTKNQRYL